MKLIMIDIILLLLLTTVWISDAISSPSSSSSSTNGLKEASKETDLASPRRRGISPFGGFRPIMRMLGIMGLPLLPIFLIRQLVAGGAGGAAPNFGGGGFGGLGLFSPLGGGGGAGGGLGGLRPFGQGLRPLGGGLRPLGGGLRPLGGLFGGAANAGQAAAAGAAAAAGGGGTALFLKKRSVSSQSSQKFTNFLTALVKLEKVFDRYDISIPDCQKLLVCEVHRRGLNPSVGSFAEKMIQAFGVEARLERSAFTSNTKSVLKEFLQAARHGLMQKGCSEIYNKCPMTAKQPLPLRRGKM